MFKVYRRGMARYLGWALVTKRMIVATQSNAARRTRSQSQERKYEYHIRHNLRLRLDRQVAGEQQGRAFRPGLT
jgi:hypothetical protein